MHAPTTHWQTIKRNLRYLKGSSYQCLHFASSNFHLIAFSDANWAGDPDARRSTSGICVFFDQNLISWLSKMQPTLSKSSTESKYRSLAVASAELAWITRLLLNLGITTQPTPALFCNNKSAIYLASNPIFHARTKHIEVDYQYVHERMLNKDLLIHYASFDNQLEDNFTKALCSPSFLHSDPSFSCKPWPLAWGGVLADC